MNLFRFPGRGGPITLAVLIALNFQAPGAWAQTSVDKGMLPVFKDAHTLTLIDDLFPPTPVTNPTSGNSSSGQTNPPTLTPTPAVGIGSSPGSSGSSGSGSSTAPGGSSPGGITTGKLTDEFRCNLFENPDYVDVLSAINTLNSAVNSPACGNSKVNVQAIVDSNNRISAAVKALHGYVDNPTTVSAQQANDIINNVDGAVQAAANLANTFGNSDLLSKECRAQMNPGQVALAINNLVNGLTPFALAAAPLIGAGVSTAVLPFLIGGSIVTNTVSSIGKIIEQNTAKVSDAQVRRAILENTCQFIRLDQKYKFLLKSRSEQIQQITQDISNSKKLFAGTDGFNAQISALMDRKLSLDQKSFDLNAAIGKAQLELNLDKDLITKSKDDLTLCQVGVQLAANAQDPKRATYVNTMLSSLDAALATYGNGTNAQAQALKASAKIAMAGLQQAGQQQFTTSSNYLGCATMTRTFIDTIDQAGQLAKHLMDLAEQDLDLQLQKTGQYAEIKSHLDAINQKRNQALRVANSLPRLDTYATVFSRDEMDTEMSRLRRGIFGSFSQDNFLKSFFSGPPPIIAWFNFVKGQQQAEIVGFNGGMTSLKQRAYMLTNSGKLALSNKPITQIMNGAQFPKDRALADNLGTLDLKHLPLGTREHADACREMQDVMEHWLKAIDHLEAMVTFCSMIDPYIFDARSEDQALVQLCRGGPRGSSAPAHSELSLITDNWKRAHLVQWGNFLKSKIDKLVCLEDSTR